MTIDNNKSLLTEVSSWFIIVDAIIVQLVSHPFLVNSWNL